MAAVENLLTSQETAAMVGVPENTLRQWRKRGQGPRSLKYGVAVMYRLEDVQAWLQKQASA